MTKYRLLFKKSVAKDFRPIPKRDVARILKCFDLLAEDPRGPGSEKISGREKYRLRSGAYRILYEIDDEAREVVVVKAERLAGRLGISRSELFQKAMRSFLDQHGSEGVTEKLNAVYRGGASKTVKTGGTDEGE